MNVSLSVRPSVIPLDGQLIAATSMDKARFFGFYDICPWSPDDREIILLACPRDFLEMPAGEPADLCVWDPATGALDKLTETKGWNWQHGARQRWLKAGAILFNDVEEGRQCARIVSRQGEPLRSFAMSVSAINPDETFGVSPNYALLVLHYPAYGYGAAHNDHIEAGPNGDGLWGLDLSTGEVSLVLSYRRLCDELSIGYSSGMFVTHPSFSPSGKKIAFFMIEHGAAGTSFMRLLVYNLVTGTVALVAEEKASHAAWIDDRRLWVWARESSAMRMVTRSRLLALPGMGLLAIFARRFAGAARNSLLSEGFFIYDTDSGNRSGRIAANLLTEDGHYSKHPSDDLMLGDTYPDASGYLTLLLYSLVSGRKIEVARFLHGVATNVESLRCDLHPRWDRAGSRICVDFCEDGVRRVGILEARHAMAEASHGPDADRRAGREGP